MDLHFGGSLKTQIRSPISVSVSVSPAVTIYVLNLPQLFSTSVLLLLVSAAFAFSPNGLIVPPFVCLFQIPETGRKVLFSWEFRAIHQLMNCLPRDISVTLV